MSSPLSRSNNKTTQIAEHLRTEIKAGHLAQGRRLQSVRELARRFDASLSVVTSAFSMLEKEGLLLREPRKGVFVTPNSPVVQSMDKRVFLCMPSQGHFFRELFMLMFERLNQRGVVPLVVDSIQLLNDRPQPEIMNQVSEILAGEPAAAMIFGKKYWQNPLLDRYPGIKKIFLLEIDHVLQQGDKAVLLDYEEANYRLARHLIERGCRRIGFVYGPVPEHGSERKARQLHHYELMFSGYERALRESNLSASERYFSVDDTDISPEWLRSLLERPGAPDALMCQLDHTAYRCRMAAQALGVPIPEKLKITGFFDTPWSRDPALPLTTVGFDLARLTEDVMGLLAGEDVPDITYAKPVLRLRNSSDSNAAEPVCAAPEFGVETAGGCL